MEVGRIDSGIVAISPFGIDIPTSSQGVRFSTKFARVETDNEVKSGEILGPAGLSVGQYFDSREILQVFVISDNINQSTRAFMVVSPYLECIENGK